MTPSPLLRWLLFALAACALALAPAHAEAQTDPLKLARYNFDYGKYDEAIRLAKEALDSHLVADGPNLVDAYRILGLSYFYVGRKDEARSAFVNLLSVDPEYTLDPLLVPPPAIVEFDTVKRENEALLAPIRERRKAIEEQRRLEAEARRKLLEEEERRRRERDSGAITMQLVEKHSFAVNFMPLGAGQFEQGRTWQGALFATGQVAGLAAAATSFVVYNDAVRTRDAAGTWRVDLSPGQITALHGLNYGGLALALLAYAGGVTDAIWHHVDQTQTTPFIVKVPSEGLPPNLAPMLPARPAAPPPAPMPSPENVPEPAPAPKPSGGTGAELFIAPTPGGASAGVSIRF